LYKIWLFNIIYLLNNMFEIRGKINYEDFESGFMVIDSTNNREEAQALLNEYQIKFGDAWTLEIVEK